jgi:hypothetical protein
MQPVVTLVRWRIVRSPFGTVHFIGVSVEDARARVSSAIVKYDPASFAGFTLSGREYHLMGESADDDDVSGLFEAMYGCEPVDGVVDSSATSAARTLFEIFLHDESATSGSSDGATEGSLD